MNQTFMNMTQSFNFLRIFSAVFLLTAFVACADRERVYTDWDANDDALLDENEWGTAWGESGYFSRWDVNDDDLIDENEWATGRTTYFIDYDEGVHGAYGDWDVDDDNMLDENEFREGVWGYYDVDDDDLWAEEEYNVWWGTVGA